MINETKTLDEQVGTSLTKNTTSTDRFYPTGLVTIIKNVGKDNEEVIVDHKPNLLTTEGKAWVHDQLYQLCSGQTGGAAYIALSNDGSHNPAAGDTRSTFEAIEETTNGLARVACSTTNKSYAAGTSKSTLQHTFTCNTGAVSGIRLSALFNNTKASGSSKLVHEASFTAVDLQVNDTLQVTWEITLS